jgi:hypothetical protein
MNLRARSVHEAVALQSFRMKATSLGRVPVLQDHSRLTRERHEVKRPGYYSSVRAAVLSGQSFMDAFSWTRNATPHLLAEFAVGVPVHPPIARIKPRSFFR